MAISALQAVIPEAAQQLLVGFGCVFQLLQDRLQVALHELRHRLQWQLCKIGADFRSFAVFLNRLTEPVQAVLVPLGIELRGDLRRNISRRARKSPVHRAINRFCMGSPEIPHCMQNPILDCILIHCIQTYFCDHVSIFLRIEDFAARIRRHGPNRTAAAI